MKNNKPNVLVLGATGKVGAETIRILEKAGDVYVIAGVRSPHKAQHLKDQEIEVRHLDLDKQETLAPALKDIDRALLLTSYTVDMLMQSKAFLDEAKQANVKHIVHIGASGAPTNQVAHWAWHQFIEKYIEALGFSFTHLRPEAFMQNITGPGYRWLEGNTILNYAGSDPWSWIDCDDLALVVATTLREADKYSGQTIQLGYDGKTFDEIAQILTDTLGKPFHAEDRPRDEFLENTLASGADPAYMNCVYHQFKLNVEGKIPDAGATFDNFEAITGQKPMTWESLISKHRDELLQA